MYKSFFFFLIAFFADSLTKVNYLSNILPKIKEALREKSVPNRKKNYHFLILATYRLHQIPMSSTVVFA